MSSVAEAAARSWRRIYFNPLAIPFWGVHILAIVGVAITGFSWWGVGLALALYWPRMFFVTGAYHRYFSHRSYKTSRVFQFLLALGSTLTAQKGPLWWAAHHRQHHKLSDQPGDLHSVIQQGFWWSHMGWILSNALEDTDYSRIKDFAKYPELRWLNKYWMLPDVAPGAIRPLIGSFLPPAGVVSSPRGGGARGGAGGGGGRAFSASPPSRRWGAPAATRPRTTRATT